MELTGTLLHDYDMGTQKHTSPIKKKMKTGVEIMGTADHHEFDNLEYSGAWEPLSIPGTGDSVKVSIQSYSNGHIDCIVHDSEQDWRFTGFYGNPEVHMRHFSWELLHRLKDMAELKEIPWLIGGDFNEICYDSEKLGGNRRAPRQMQAFREVLELCELQDLHCSGEFFTWVNRRDSANIIFERLDRFVGNMKWRLHFPVARVTSLEFYHSDHRPLCLQLYSDQLQDRIRRANLHLSFRFEKGWLLEEGCREVIEHGWGSSDIGSSILQRINSCKNDLLHWDSSRLRRIPKRLKSKRDHLNTIKTSTQWHDNISQINMLEIEIENLATQEEMYWRQQSRIS
ncbi:uncharacterized protein [Primulina huaijiensis]|uniref:uncharacterized protein n=1 Tax=Primulina huaijiensis TaxID=1492673 RepID=UPI003CC72BE5